MQSVLGLKKGLIRKEVTRENMSTMPEHLFRTQLLVRVTPKSKLLGVIDQ